MISLTNHDFQWGRSEVVIIYPNPSGTWDECSRMAMNHLESHGRPIDELKLLVGSLWHRKKMEKNIAFDSCYSWIFMFKEPPWFLEKNLENYTQPPFLGKKMEKTGNHPQPSPHHIKGGHHERNGAQQHDLGTQHRLSMDSLGELYWWITLDNYGYSMDNRQL